MSSDDHATSHPTLAIASIRARRSLSGQPAPLPLRRHCGHGSQTSASPRRQGAASRPRSMAGLEDWRVAGSPALWSRRACRPRRAQTCSARIASPVAYADRRADPPKARCGGPRRSRRGASTASQSQTINETAERPQSGALTGPQTGRHGHHRQGRQAPSSPRSWAQRCTREPHMDHHAEPFGQGWTRILTFSSLLLISSSKPSLTMSSSAIRPVMNWNGSTFPLAIISIVAGWSFA